MTTFGEIRSMLHSPTTDAARIEAWEELLKTLMKEFRTREEEVSEEWLPYVMGVLDQQWPDEARVAPRDWVNKLARGLDPHPLMPLVRAIDVRRKPNPHFISMCQGEGFEWVRHMTFGGQRLKLASVEALAEAETFASLTSLTMHSARLGLHKITALARAPFADNLTRLRLPYCNLKDNGIKALLKHFNVEKIQTLDLRQFETPYQPSYAIEAMEALCKAEVPALLDLDISGWTDPQIPLIILKAPWLPQLERLRLLPQPLALENRPDILPAVLQAITDSELAHETRADRLASMTTEILDVTSY